VKCVYIMSSKKNLSVRSSGGKLTGPSSQNEKPERGKKCELADTRTNEGGGGKKGDVPGTSVEKLSPKPRPGINVGEEENYTMWSSPEGVLLFSEGREDSFQLEGKGRKVLAPKKGGHIPSIQME